MGMPCPYRARNGPQLHRFFGIKTSGLSTAGCHSLSSAALPLWNKDIWTINGWLQLIVSGLFPSSVFKSNDFTQHFKYPGTDARAVVKYLEILTQRVQKKISNFILEKIAVIFDG